MKFLYPGHENRLCAMGTALPLFWCCCTSCATRFQIAMAYSRNYDCFMIRAADIVKKKRKIVVLSKDKGGTRCLSRLAFRLPTWRPHRGLFFNQGSLVFRITAGFDGLSNLPEEIVFKNVRA